jgi:UMF1 family MFS transporter
VTGSATDRFVADQRAARREQRGWYFYDWASSAFSTTVITVFLGPYLTSVAQAAADAGEQVTLLGVVPVAPESYFPFMVSISVALQVLLLPLVGGLADVSSRKKYVMAAGAYVGALAVMGMFFLDGTRYQLGGVLFLIANVAFGASLVVYNSFLPDIASPDERDGVSSRAWAMGYVGGIILLVANLVLFLGHDAFGVTESAAVRISLFSAGAWWAIFTLIPLARLVNRPAKHVRTGSALTGGFRQLGATLRELPRYPQALLFLAAFFFFNDGIMTVIGLSATYADIELGLSTTLVIAAVIIVQIVGIAGALILGRLARSFGAKRVVLASLVMWSVTLVIAFVIPAGAGTLFLVLAALIGFVLGGSQALARSLFAQLVPRDREAEYFSLYEVSNGASSILGPLVFGLSLQLLGSYRIAILALVVFFIIGGILLARVNVRVGVEQANRVATA